jgi:predicted metal-dependent peptidase
MTEEERLGVVVHELLHIVHRHIQRSSAFASDFRVLNFAADIINNRDILTYTHNYKDPYRRVQEGIDLPRMCILDGLFDFRGKETSTTDEIYAILIEAKRKAKAKGPMSEAERDAFLAKHPGLAEEPTPQNRFGLSPSQPTLGMDPEEYYRFSLGDKDGKGGSGGSGSGDEEEDDSSSGDRGSGSRSRGGEKDDSSSGGRSGGSRSRGGEKDDSSSGDGSDASDRDNSDAVGGHSDHSHWEEDSDNFDGQNQYGEDLDKEAQGKINRALVDAARKSDFNGVPGSLSGFLRELMKGQAPLQDWRAILRMQVASSASIRKKTTSMKESRRFPREPGLPGGMGTKTLRDVNVTVAVDTSGSIDQQILAQFMAEIEKMQKSNAEVSLFFFHHDVYGLDKGGKPALFKKFDVNTFNMESGGTDFTPPFRVVKQLSKKPDLFILLTDGIAFPPTVNLGTVKYLWAIYGGPGATQESLKADPYVKALPGKKIYLANK